MPREGLSETGQIIAAVATAIILALLAKYGFLPDEDDGKKESEDTGKTVINIQIGTQRIEEAARDGREFLSPAKGTPLKIDASGVKEEPFEKLNVGALPIQMRSKNLLPTLQKGIVGHPTTMFLVVVLDQHFGTQATISVWSDGFAGLRGDDYDDSGWVKLGIQEVGDLNGQMHFLVEVPVNWSAKDLSGRVRQLMVLCRTDDATKDPDPSKCESFLERARTDVASEYFLKASKPLNLFNSSTGVKQGSASLANIDKGMARMHWPAVYIPYRTGVFSS